MIMNTKTIRKSAIRWPGLAAFGVIVGLLMAFSWLLLDSILRWTMERSLGALNGAEVNIERVEHSWSPLGVRVVGVQLTDPAAPLRNRLVVGDVQGTLNVEQLLLGRLHFEQVVGSGIRVDQPRNSAGEVYQAPTKDDVKDWAGDALAALNLDVPNVDEVVARIDLKTPQAVAQAQATFSTVKERLQAARNELPSEATIRSYQQQLEALNQGDMSDVTRLVERKEQFDALRQQFAADRDKIEAFKQLMTELKTMVQTDLQALREAPQQDLARVQELLQLNGDGLAEITALLFGEQMRQWSQYLLLAYEQLAPMLSRAGAVDEIKPQRGEGVWFSFAGSDSAPEFLIKQAQTEFEVAGTVIAVDWENITHQHELLGQPTVYSARAENTTLWSSLNLNGELSLRDSGVNARQQWQLSGVQLNALGLSDQPQFMAAIVSALLDSEGSVALRNGELDGTSTVRLAQLDINASAENQWAQVVASALTELQQLDMQVAVSGAMAAPQLQVRSDLDRQLGGALKAAAMERGKAELANFTSGLQQQTAGVLGNGEADLELINGLLGNAEDRDAQLQKLLETKLQENLQEQLKDRLRGRLGG